ncbi:phage baseplate assembly protein V [Candidatus Schmidhempelia bombi]|uniref:Phage baseplate assembly protein V n=1 Tax=Candidatus Schmidhempelia bombi str. Bimp TaxID=1387197 RepID=A0AB94IAI7_9GAMM|nr:phage baseplate assembly protein V [Candidatus Schmidhempelia bombi]TEA26396.1 phage baseplate assembly protein V [Candidatus Schmidhempelia bombi str. Bimp]
MAGMLMRKVLNKIMNIVSRGYITFSNSSSKCQTLQIKMSGGEQKSDIEHIEPYGFTSRPLDGAEAVALFLDGDKSHGVILAAGDRRYRIKSLKKGEVAIYTDEGDCICLNRDNQINIKTKKFIVNAEELIELNAKNVLVNASSQAQFTTPLLTSTGDIADKTSTMTNIRTIYNGHTHNETDSVTQSPNQLLK